MFRASTVALTLLAWAAAGDARADDPPRTLTLEAAIQEALRADERPRLAETRLAKARAARDEAFAKLLPTIQMSGTYTRRPVEVSVTGPNGPAYFQRYNALAGQASIDATVFDARAFPALGATDVEIGRQALTVEETRRLVAFEAASTFVAVLAAEEVLAAAERRVTYAATTLADAKARRGTGLATTADVTRSELEASTARLSVTQSKQAVALARLSLGTLLARSVDEALAPPDSRPMPEDADLPARAVASRADVTLAARAVETARVAAQEPWLRLIPTVGVRAIGTATNESGFNPATNGNLSATLTWVLFDGGVRYAQAAARAADLEAAELTVDQAKKRVALEVRTASVRLSSAQAAAVEAAERETLARRNADEVAARFKSGLASVIEQADAAQSAFDAASDAARQKWAVRDAELALLEALGRWPAGNDGPAESGATR